MRGILEAEGKRVSLSKLCTILGLPRRSFYYRPVERVRKLNEELVGKVKEIIEKFPSYGYRMISAVLKVNRKPVQRILQIKKWQVRKRAKGHRPRVQALKSRAEISNVRWATDLAKIWCGRDGWCSLALVIDCCDRGLIGWRLSKRGNAKIAEAALEEALIARFGQLAKLDNKLALRSDNGLVFTSKLYTKTTKAYNLEQEFITPYTPEQNGLIERFIRTLKEDCVWLHRFESLAHATATIGAWIRYYNTERPHSSLGYKPPVESIKLAA